MSSSSVLKIPNVRTAVTVQPSQSAAYTKYSGIAANLLLQGIITDAIKMTAIGGKCPKTELANMVADTISVQAAQRS